MVDLQVPNLPYRLIFISPVLFMIIASISAGVIPLEEDRIIQKACTSTKVACDPGWTCQMGVIVFPSSSDQSLDCESFDKDCLQVSENRYSANSMEVYCIREGRRARDHRPEHNLLALLERVQNRGHRAACTEWCRSAQDCAAGEECIFNGCGQQCAKRPILF
ncbi:uncharacterized protein LOC129599682 [Paramacrobiotus metropolitanus]|uniref:uncharacterized protein LOC129599682 n=1 Tax=Paramacrobiotus metropolitanus TaxID=2943436 RepID=UPI002445C8A7|nr:uncharacterized protein LOC129599682 [Paramacrobiotus metropolitanus]